MTKEENKKLCEMYPFLIPASEMTGQRITDGVGYFAKDPDRIPEYDWEYTKLDEMPIGWRNAFGEALCRDLKDALCKIGMIEKYRVWEIKEKYGELRWYDNDMTGTTYPIVDQYTERSRRVCIHCGKTATRITQGYILPFCDDCLQKDQRLWENSKPITLCNPNG